MRKEDLHNALMHPENLSDDQLMELRETVKRFPFFGAAQIALTRAYKARGDVQFTDQLSQAAIYTGHRSSLYHRLKGTQINKTAATEEIVTSSEHSLASIILEEETTPTVSVVQQPSSTDTIEPLVKIEAPEEHESLSTEVSPERIELKLSEMDALNAQILVSAVSNTIEMEVQSERSQEEQETAQSADLEPEDESSYAAMIYRRAQRKHLLPTESDLSDKETTVDADLPAFRSTPLSHGVQRIRSTDAKQHQRDLIDRFIHTEPQIARGKAGDYPTGNMAKDSLEEDFSMVTETMAVLFAKQGKLDKARKAFRKLMEQHPEKSIYFAAQLKNLEHFKK